MKLLVFSDIHGDKAALQKLMDIEADYYFADGDLANWGRGLDQMGPILQKRADRMYVLPGNHESEHDIEQFSKQYGFHNFHARSMQIGKFAIAGLGYSNPTPFNTPGEYSEEELAKRLEPFAGLDPLILMFRRSQPSSTARVARCISAARRCGTLSIFISRITSIAGTSTRRRECTRSLGALRLGTWASAGNYSI